MIFLKLTITASSEDVYIGGIPMAEKSCAQRLQLASSKRWSLENNIRDIVGAFASFENPSSGLVRERRCLELKVERGIHSDSGWMYIRSIKVVQVRGGRG